MPRSNSHENAGRPTEMRALDQLNEIIAESTESDGWLRRAIAAIHVCTFAVEERLDALGGAGGIAEKFEREEPGLAPSFKRLISQFNRLLAEAWETERASRGPSEQFQIQLKSLASELSAAVSKEFGLTEDAMNRMSAAVD